MSELHVTVLREIGGRAIVGDIEIDTDDLDSLPEEKQATILLKCYQSASEALDEKEVEWQLQSIKDIPIK